MSFCKVRSVLCSPVLRVSLLFASALVGMVLCLGLVPAHAGSIQDIGLTIVDPTQIVGPNSTITYMGTITNNTGASLDVYRAFLVLDFSGYGALVNPSDLLGLAGTPPGPDFTIPNGGTSPDVPLFTFALGPNAPIGSYQLEVQVGDAGFDVSNVVTVTETATPEPPTWSYALIVAGLFFLWRFRGLLSQKFRGAATGAAVLSLFTLLFWASPGYAQGPAFVGSSPGASLFAPNLSVALRLVNDGTAAATNVQLTSITSPGAVPTSPGAFPVALGSIPAGGNAIVNASFTSASFAPSGTYLVTIKGTYLVSGTAAPTLNFTVNQFVTIPKASPGSSPLQYVQATSSVVSGGGYPPGSGLVNANEGDNDRQNRTTPIGPFVAITKPSPKTINATSLPQITGSANGLFRKTNSSSAELQSVSTGSAATAAMSSVPHKQAPASPPTVMFYRDTDMYAGLFVPPQVPQLGQNCDYNGIFGVCAEPSGAAEPGGTIFATANAPYNSYSPNGGGLNAWSVDGIFASAIAPEPSFHPVYVDCPPSPVPTSCTNVFPTALDPSQWPPPVCCDQVVQYAPTIDRFIWLMQLWNGGNTGTTNVNGYRLAWASPADIATYAGTRWSYVDLPASLLASPFNISYPNIDYPDLSIGNNYVYLSWDLYSYDPSTVNNSVGRQAARISLANLQAGGQISIGLTDPADGSLAWGAHLTQDTLDAVFWAGHADTSHLRVFSWKETDNSYSWQDVQHPSFNTAGLSSKTPDGRDWMSKLSDFPADAVIGATRVLGTPVVTGNGPPPETYDLWFAWTVGPIGDFPQPYIAMVRVDQNFNEFDYEIWGSQALGYPALATNLCTQEVGVSLVAGGNGHYQSHEVGILGDSMLYPTVNSNVGVTRWGDYVSIRQAPPTALNPGNLFLAFGFGVASSPRPGTGGTSVRYVVFGRPSSSCIVIQ
jgi:hypothetical protein